MDHIELSREVEERYRRYLKTTFYFKDPQFRASFEEALNAGHLSKGPYLEATPVFKRGQTPRALFQDLLGSPPGVRALILYPMNALANDQRERLGRISTLLEDTEAPFRFSFGQYIGETPSTGVLVALKWLCFCGA